MAELRITFEGAPRTKKNHGRVVHARGRPLHLPSEAYSAWCDAASPRITAAMRRIFAGDIGALVAGVDVKCNTRLRGFIDYPVNCAALFYRDANRGDAVGYYQGLADLLEAAGVVKNDKWIVSWDGSRLFKDAARPRVELMLSWQVKG